MESLNFSIFDFFSKEYISNQEAWKNKKHIHSKITIFEKVWLIIGENTVKEPVEATKHNVLCKDPDDCNSSKPIELLKMLTLKYRA